jgi:hypothetical protein
MEEKPRKNTEEAKNIYKDVCPDEKIFEEYDSFLKNLDIFGF